MSERDTNDFDPEPEAEEFCNICDQPVGWCTCDDDEDEEDEP